MNLKDLLETEATQLTKLNEIVSKAVVEEGLITDKLSEFEDNRPRLVSKMADKVAEFGGSWTFVFALRV